MGWCGDGIGIGIGIGGGRGTCHRDGMIMIISQSQ
jgi:hypothetical protein